jgi:glucokinase
MVIGSHQRNCNCGRNGCFETFVSATALMNAYNDMLPGEPVRSAKEVFDMMTSGDLNATVVVERFCEHFAIGIVNLYNIFAPEVIALGGGVAQAFPLFIDKLNEAVSKRLFTNDLEYGKIVEAELGNDAGIIGAAYLDQF